MKAVSSFEFRVSSRPTRRIASLAAICVLAIATLGAGPSNARFNALGHKLMCKCGCNQVLLECNHVGCTVSERMRQELAAAIDRGDNDNLILQNFVQEYGLTVLAAPPATGFNRVAWIMPFAVLGLGFALAIVVVRRWKQRPAPVQGVSAVDLEAFRQRARQETEL